MGLNNFRKSFLGEEDKEQSKGEEVLALSERGGLKIEVTFVPGGRLASRNGPEIEGVSLNSLT